MSVVAAIFVFNILLWLLSPLLIWLFIRRLLRSNSAALRGIPADKHPTKPFLRRMAIAMVVLACGFCGLMIAVVGGVIHPPVIELGGAALCDGNLATDTQAYSYKPGQSGTSLAILCTQRSGAVDDITLPAIGMSALIYSGVLLMAALLLWKWLSALRTRQAAMSGAGMMRINIGVARHVQGNVAVDPAGTDATVEARLRRLQALRDRDMISEAEYQTKRAQILSAL